MGDSVRTPELVTTRKSHATWFPFWVGSGILLALVVWLYHSVLYHLFLQWGKDPNFSHGFFVPAFALFVLWQERARLRSVRISPSWTGLPLLAFGLLMLLFGVLGVELFTARSSLLVLVAGLVVLFFGWAMFRAVLFPWAFSFLMIPLPAIILQRVTFPLQLFVSKLSAWCLQLVGIPVLLEGNVIKLPNLSLEVVQACSGMRSLVSLLTLAIMYGYLIENRNWVRVVLACSAVPIAIAANVFRIFGTGLLGELWNPDKAQGFFHEFQGWLVFLVSLALLFAVHRLINLIWKPEPAQAPSPPREQSPLSATAPVCAYWPLRFLITTVLLLATAVVLQAHPPEVVPTPPPISSLPTHFDNWSGTDIAIDQEQLDVLGPGEFLMRDYENTNQDLPGINLFVAYFPSQQMGDTIHSPDHCLPGAGWIPTQRGVVTITRSDGTSFPANRYVVSKAGDRELALYWFQAHGREVASEYSAKYYLIADSIRLNRSDGALVRLMTPMYPDETADAAQARLMQLGNQFLPFLDNSIPR